MKRIVITSFKGGVGKSSVALHLGCCLAKYHNKKALLVDFDSQSNLSVGCGLSPDNRATMSEVLKGTKKMEDIIQETKTKNLFIAPANTYLDGIESSQSLVTDLYAHERLSYNLERLKYDYILIDVPPSLGWLTQSAFYASTHSLIVAIPELYSFLAVHRLKKYHATIETRPDILPGLKPMGF
jgi:chromosome partitioning protein